MLATRFGGILVARGAFGTLSKTILLTPAVERVPAGGPDDGGNGSEEPEGEAPSNGESAEYQPTLQARREHPLRLLWERYGPYLGELPVGFTSLDEEMSFFFKRDEAFEALDCHVRQRRAPHTRAKLHIGCEGASKNRYHGSANA